MDADEAALTDYEESWADENEPATLPCTLVQDPSEPDNQHSEGVCDYHQNYDQERQRVPLSLYRQPLTDITHLIMTMHPDIETTCKSTQDICLSSSSRLQKRSAVQFLERSGKRRNLDVLFSSCVS
ncbi:hypothetical protein KP509_27G002900 [Ceratopteris richardii]|uniref:Uncharacterized protein n=1 Tax=Ceratopteris richardii TaxID=49495 RepID=A0A8T2RFW3_CERRI|nr:hypothetical protein KP509_27G002900 [Ceratopteris richardii]